MSAQQGRQPGSRDGRLVRRWVPATILLAAAAGVAMLAVTPSRRPEAPVTQAAPVNVTTLTVRAMPTVEDTFDLPGTVEPNRVVKVSAEVPGQVEAYGRRLEEVRWQGRLFARGQVIEEGEPVREGDVLVQLNRDILTAERDRAKAQYDYDQSEHERILGLQQRGATTAREITEAAMKVAVSRAVLQAAQEQLDRTTIRAPIGGVLNTLGQEVGEYVQPGTEIAQIVDLDPVKIAVYVPERDVAFLSVGQLVKVLGAGDQVLVGRTSYIAELAEPQTRSSRVEVTIPNPEHRLRSGQIVRVRLTRRVLQDVILVPLDAVIPLEQGYEVFVVSDGLARSRKVKLGPIRQDKIVVEGLAEGDQLIVAGHRFVGDGQRVQVIEWQDPQARVSSSGSGLPPNEALRQEPAVAGAAAQQPAGTAPAVPDVSGR